MLFAKADADLARGQLADRTSEVHQITSQAVHRVTDNRVTFPNKLNQDFELRALDVLPEPLSRNTRSSSSPSSWRLFVLFEATHPHVAHRLSLRWMVCGIRLYCFRDCL